MKRVLTLSLAVGLGVLLGGTFDGVRGTAEAGGARGGGAGVAGNGDVNGDGALNLSDASYLLNRLFRGGPVPVPCSLEGGAAGLPDTGRTACYAFVENEGWVEVACGDETCAGQDGDYATGCPIDAADGAGRFVDNGDGTVTDTCTGLMWQKDTADVNGDGIVGPESRDVLFPCDALAYCEDLSFAGHDDWRLPNLRELQSIVDYGRVDPAIDPVFGALSSWYWSSTSSAVVPHHSWGVHFVVGSVSDGAGNDGPWSYVRAVRSTAEAGGAQGGGAGVAGNGDVNGDGVINLSDASYLLNWLFGGGPVPVPCSPEGGAAGLPDTGQTACYEGWVEVPCGEATCAGQDGAYATGCPIDGPDGSGRFVDNGDGTVTDTCTGLMWQQDTADVNGDEIVSFESGDALPWCDALAYCEDLSFAGHEDWRLPNVRELQSIVDYGRVDPAIDPVFGALSSGYWSSTSSVFPGIAWDVVFSVGAVGYGGADKGSSQYIRAVRSGP